MCSEFRWGLGCICQPAPTVGPFSLTATSTRCRREFVRSQRLCERVEIHSMVDFSRAVGISAIGIETPKVNRTAVHVSTCVPLFPRNRVRDVGAVVANRHNQLPSVTQRKVFTTPDHNEVDDVNVTNILPKVRCLNKERGCVAVSIGEKCHRSIRHSWPDDSPSESGPCVKTMLADTALRCNVPFRSLRIPVYVV